MECTSLVSSMRTRTAYTVTYLPTRSKGSRYTNQNSAVGRWSLTGTMVGLCGRRPMRSTSPMRTVNLWMNLTGAERWSTMKKQETEKINRETIMQLYYLLADIQKIEERLMNLKKEAGYLVQDLMEKSL